MLITFVLAVRPLLTGDYFNMGLSAGHLVGDILMNH